MELEESRSLTSDDTQSYVAWQKQNIPWHRPKNRNRDLWGRTEGPEKNSNIYGHRT